MKDDGEISAATDGVKYASVVPEPTAETSTAETESYTERLMLLISAAGKKREKASQKYDCG